MHVPASDATTRFTSRVADYIRYRPGYPAEVIASLAGEFGLTRKHLVIDIGCGTGISAELFLRNGNPVIGIEPNDDMRAAADQLLSTKYPRFQLINGTAEETTLADRSADWIVAAQAFHWFAPAPTRAEFDRILRPPGRIVLMWNNRREDTPFLVAYERFLREFASDYERVKHQDTASADRIAQFMTGRRYEVRTFPNQQLFGFDGLLGRVCSSSYMPQRTDVRYPELVDALRRLFDQYAGPAGTEDQRRIALDYETAVHVGIGAS